MAFWSGEKLKEELAPLITGYDENAIDCAAYTLRIGNEIYISPDHKVEILSQHTKQKLRPGEGFAIPPGQFAFLTTQEEITVPDTAIAFISIRARPKFRGLINISGFHVDPGYKGQLVFSVLNAGPTPHHLEEGQKLFLIWFADLDRQTAMKKEEDEGFGQGTARVDVEQGQRVKTHEAFPPRDGINKSDKADAEGLAQLSRTGWFTKVHVRSEASDRVRALVGARERLIRMRKDLEAHIRGVLKTFGIRMGAVPSAHHRQGFRDQLAEAGACDPMLGLVAQTMIPIHKTLCASAEALADELMHVAKQNTLARRLMTVPGVGPLVALNFIATLDDASRFRRSSDVGAFLGLTPRRYQSGEIDRSGRISKCGDAEMRRLLVSAAASLMTQVRRFSPLKSWAIRLSARKGFKKAAVATARKIAVILHAIWRDGTEFNWKGEPAT
ncbi:IS110 family transposase [Paracoccus saliphilus]|uniref:IS110 family transposase n=2 Tax=Paracoccus saliphilus TaxID=405559 RepID=A0ABY7SA44_9RHOB|nr:IS110 family transposase [Paracoccus saliphilus]WCR03760.1 IS110 family transposase [Paracoccus saliphilus]